MPSFSTSDAVTIVYDDLGPRDGRPVVLCHGLAASGMQLRADAEHFAGLGWRVLVPDLRGHGRSGRPPSMRPADFSIPRMAEDLLGMLDHAGVGPVCWVGNSLGGILALELLRAHEARFASLATFGTAYRLALPAWLGELFPWGERLLGRAGNARFVAWSTTRNRAARPLIEKLIRGFDPAVGRLVAGNLTRYDLIANATAATLPILMLRGRHDGAINAALQPTLAAMAVRPNFKLVELESGGHCANLDATEALRAALLEFWDGR